MLLSLRPLLPFTLGALAAAACGSPPKADDDTFSLTVLSMKVVQAVGSVTTTLASKDCQDLTATLEIANRGKFAVEVSPTTVGGSFRASMDAAVFAPTDGSCKHDAASPVEGVGTIEATCKATGKTARVPLFFSYAPVWRVVARNEGPIEAIVRGQADDRFFMVGNGFVDAVEGTTVGKAQRLEIGADGAPLLAHLDTGFLAHYEGCPKGDCGIFFVVDTPTSKVGQPAAKLAFLKDGDPSITPDHELAVPTNAVDLVSDGPSGWLVAAPSGGVSVTQVTSDAVTPAAYFPGETSPTPFASRGGARVFLTRGGDGTVRMHGTDGALIGVAQVPGEGPLDYLALAPSGDAWVTVRSGKASLTTLDGPGFTPTAIELPSQITDFAAPNTFEDSSWGAAFTTSGVALRGTSRVEVYARAAPHALVWSADLGQPIVTGAMGVGDRLAVLTGSGLRIFDAAGKPFGGVEPSANCGRAGAGSYYAQAMALVAPDVVALAGNGVVYELNLAMTSLGPIGP